MSATKTPSGKKPVRILSIDGGGIRGILPLAVLQAIETATGKKIAEMFDLIAGTSTGGIIACGLVAGTSIEDLTALYAENGDKIFPGNRLGAVGTAWDMLTGPKYSAEPLEGLLTQVLGEKRTLSDLPADGPELLVPAYCLTLPEGIPLDGSSQKTTRFPYFFKSWKASGRDIDPGDDPKALDFKLWQVARATSAAPTYFAPAQIRNEAGQTFYMVDGGVFANSPDLVALAAARKLFDADEFIVVSLGTGALEAPIDGADAVNWGVARWFPAVILSVLMDGAGDTVSYVMDQFADVTHQRFQISTGTTLADGSNANDAMDDASRENIARLRELGQILVKTEAARLDQVAALLKNSQPAARRKPVAALV